MQSTNKKFDDYDDLFMVKKIHQLVRQGPAIDKYRHLIICLAKIYKPSLKFYGANRGSHDILV